MFVKVVRELSNTMHLQRTRVFTFSTVHVHMKSYDRLEVTLLMLI